MTPFSISNRPSKFFYTTLSNTFFLYVRHTGIVRIHDNFSAEKNTIKSMYNKIYIRMIVGVSVEKSLRMGFSDIDKYT